MRKQTKIAALVSAAALLAIGASMTSLADWNPVGSNGDYEWLDRYGDPVTNEWHTGVSGDYYYVGDDGLMARDTLVEYNDALYYVASDGRKVVNQWVRFDNTEGITVNDNDVASLYYFFQDGTGKAVQGTSKTLKVSNTSTETAKFLFTEEGYMISGWYTDGDGNVYYLGGEDEGWALTGWQEMEPPTEEENPYESDTVWYNFGSDGKMKKGGPLYLDYGDGRKFYFMFGSNGILVEDTWVDVTDADTASGSTPATIGKVYYADGGPRMTGWQKVKDIADGDSGWYYLNAKGVAFNSVHKDANEDGTVAAWSANDAKFGAAKTGYAARVIKGKTYLFNPNGKMVTGIFKVENVAREGSATALGADGETIYYFGGNGDMIVNRKESITNDYDETFYYSFGKDGAAAVNQIVSGVLYGANGVRVEAVDANWQVVTLQTAVTSDKRDADGNYVVIPAGSQVVVNATGRVKESGTVTIDGTKYYIKDGKTDANDTIAYVIAEKENVD